MQIGYSQLYVACWLGSVALGLNACGLASPDYQAYEIEGAAADSADPSDNSDTTGADDVADIADEACATALTAWESNMKATVDARCAVAGCHADAAFLDLSQNQDEENRQSLYDYIAGDITTLTSRIHGGVHTGGDFTSDLPLASISDWHSAESECQ